MSYNGVNGNGVSPEAVTFHTQGSEFSWHAYAAREFARQNSMQPRPRVGIAPHDEFGDVIHACRTSERDLGIMAIRTAVGTVEKAAGKIITEGEAALPPIVGRIDINVRLALVGTEDHDYDAMREKRGKGIKVLSQKPAWLQCAKRARELLPLISAADNFRNESTVAIEEVLERNQPNLIGLGPAYSVHKMGGVILGPRRINERNSVTSFYIMQRDGDNLVFPQDPRERQEADTPEDPKEKQKTDVRTVLSLAVPDTEGDFRRCMQWAEDAGLQITRYIPFNVDKQNRRSHRIKHNGGILEVAHGFFDIPLTEFRARVQHMNSRAETKPDFVTHRLGKYWWYPEEPIDPLNIDGTAHLPAHTEIPTKPVL